MSDSNITIAQALVNIEDAIRNGSGGGSSELGTSTNALINLTESTPFPYTLVMPDKTTVLAGGWVTNASAATINDSLYVALPSKLRLAVYDDDNEQIVEDVTADGTLSYDGMPLNLYKMVAYDEEHLAYIALVYEHIG